MKMVILHGSASICFLQIALYVNVCTFSRWCHFFMDRKDISFTHSHYQQQYSSSKVHLLAFHAGAIICTHYISDRPIHIYNFYYISMYLMFVNPRP